MLEQRLLALGMAADSISQHPSDTDATSAVLAELEAGDLALLFIHEDSAAILEQLNALAAG